MTMIKRILVSVMAVLMLLSMAACGAECDYCGKTLKGNPVDGKYCTQRCSLASKGCARCGGNILEKIEALEEQDRIDDATNPNLAPGQCSPERQAYIVEGKIYCCMECALGE